MRYYIYKLTFKNGCTYIGKHSEKRSDDGYITSSVYYKKHPELLEKREIILDNLPDSETLSIMETICILGDKCSSPYNVNYNRGSWLSSRFDMGYKGPANGMYGKHLKDTMTPEDFEMMNRKRSETIRKKSQAFRDAHDGLLPFEYKKMLKKRYNEKLRTINKQIRDAHKLYKKKRHYWFYNPETLQETYLPECPEGFIKGRLPHELWTDERKQSYSEKHSINVYDRMDELQITDIKSRLSNINKNRVWYTNGYENVFLMQGDDVPDGFFKGFSFKKTEKYRMTRRKKGESNRRQGDGCQSH